MTCTHKLIIKKDIKKDTDSVKILKCKLCGEEFIECMGYIRKVNKQINPDFVLGMKL